MSKTYPPMFYLIEMDAIRDEWTLCKQGYLNGTCVTRHPMSTDKINLHDMQAILSVPGLSATNITRIQRLKPGNMISLYYRARNYTTGLRRVTDDELVMIEQQSQTERDLKQIRQQIAACIPQPLVDRERELKKQLRDNVIPVSGNTA